MSNEAPQTQSAARRGAREYLDLIRAHEPRLGALLFDGL
jgi:hypothetical protein